MKIETQEWLVDIYEKVVLCAAMLAIAVTAADYIAKVLP